MTYLFPSIQSDSIDNYVLVVSYPLTDFKAMLMTRLIDFMLDRIDILYIRTRVLIIYLLIRLIETRIIL